MRNKIKSIREIINSESAFEKVRQEVKKYDVIKMFPKIFPDLQKMAKAIKVDKTTLFIKVESSVWKSELNLRKNILINKINNHFNEKVISNIKFL